MSRYPDMQTILHRHVLKISRCAHKIHFVPWAAPETGRGPRGKRRVLRRPLVFLLQLALLILGHGLLDTAEHVEVAFG